MLTVHTFHELGSIDSTNNCAMQAVKNGEVLPGTAWFSSHQTAGKGQRGRSWQSEPGKNMALSLALQPKKPLEPGLFHFNALVALACLRVLGEFLPGEHFTLKWPNDIYWGDRKAGGILTENLIQGGVWRWSVTGIGLNINQEVFPDLETKAVSLKQIIGQELNSMAIAKRLQKLILENLNALQQLDGLMDGYNGRLWKKGEWVKLQYQGKVSEHRIISVDEQGRLLTKSVTEESLIFHHGQVDWIP